MTIESVRDRILAHSFSKPMFGPFAWIIISSVIGAFLTHYIEKCLNHIDPESVRSPSVFQRWRLKRLLRKLTAQEATRLRAKSIAQYGRAADTDSQSDMVDEAYNAVLAYGRSLTAGDYAALQTLKG